MQMHTTKDKSKAGLKNEHKPEITEVTQSNFISVNRRKYYESLFPDYSIVEFSNLDLVLT